MTGADLIRRMAEGDRDAFKQLYERHARDVYPLVLRIVRDPSDAGDVLQEAFWDAWQTAASYDPARGTPEAWLFMRARTRAMDRFRAVGGTSEASSAPREDGDAEALALAYYAGLMQTEIAERLEQPLGTVKARIRQALERLREVREQATTHEPFDTLAAVYAVGALNGDDLVRLEAHVRGGCANCEESIRDSREALTAMSRQLPPASPPAEIRDALLRRVEASSRPRVRRWGWVPWAVATAAAALAAAAFAAGVVAARYEKSMGMLARETARVRDQVQREQHRLRDEVAAARAVGELLRDPETRIVALTGVAAAPSAAPKAGGRVVWNERAGGRVYVSGLPAAPPGQTYELWAIAGSTPRPAGTLDVDQSGTASRPVAATEGPPVTAFTVTLEPAGGLERPTGPAILITR
jgi:RNA polymerase sigma-70 factor (ECF subfamily)